jgi:hypothetical protein
MYGWPNLLTIIAVFAAGYSAGLFSARRRDRAPWSALEWTCCIVWAGALVSLASWFARSGLQ